MPPPKRSVTQVRAKTEMAKKVMVHHYGKTPRALEFKTTGLTNFVFEAKMGRHCVIVRIGGVPAKLHDFRKEQWAAARAREKGVPVPEILEVGNGIIPLPYMLLEKVDGEPALNHAHQPDILFQLGKYAKRIHSIPTVGFGHDFDWNDDPLAPKKNWVTFLEEELQATERLKFLQRHQFLPKAKMDHLTEFLDRVKKWKFASVLNHCDLRLKNVMVDKKGVIKAILDWDNCTSNIAPYWDLSIALHDLSIDSKHKFLEGYGLDMDSFTRHSYGLTVFNLLNYVPYLEEIMRQGREKELALYRLRLNGSLDLFSL